MTFTIRVCKANTDKSLTVLSVIDLPVTLNESDMEVYATYKGKQYKVDGTAMFSFIVI